MKQTQGVFFTGYVTIQVKGHHPEFFLNFCMKEKIPAWNIKKMDRETVKCNIRIQDIEHIRVMRRKTRYKITFVNKHGFPFLTNKFLRRKPFITGLLLSFLFVMVLSNIVWDIEVKGVNPEIENEIVEKLNDYGIQPGSMKFTVGKPGKIQQKLLKDIPELLWVGVTEKGTTYYLEGVEKTVVEEEEKNGPNNLIAAKKGTIVDMFVSKGKPMVEVNDVVEKGDLLVSANIGKEEEDEEGKAQDRELVGAKGEVIAETWYKVKMNVAKSTTYEVLTGNKEKSYSLNIAGFTIPIWGFFSPDFANVKTETNEKPFQFLKWELPVAFVETTIYEKINKKEQRSEQEARKVGIKQASQDLQTELGKNAVVSFKKVLHESTENGKVKLILYFNVREDIAKNQPISQGD
ncbi:sporulation protein YqfD [Aquibacillus sp. 3ASR75-11]|uniref:Sporulation protein YqfD n=1 Tax=Terrihalobacillus insolitus TaxID=2950438 RepID=A0A9X3WU87_9BACI|nr:sporulation protein YqfD [Terrihalobacillus insolitus]MDC3413350.1 sporulation protein YqfD [Terrihalobacillus insolitus]MDC3424933.1 sporulation protein YqfD [Terrihalobacillus insolitus]